MSLNPALSLNRAELRSFDWKHHQTNRLRELQDVAGSELVDAVLAELNEAATLSNALRFACNARAAVLKLPTELLVYIISLLQGIWEPTGNWYRSPDKLASDIHGWLNVTFVCRSWRSAVLGTASLWTRVHFHLGDEWIVTFFERAKALPAVLSFDYLDDVRELFPDLCEKLRCREQTWPQIYKIDALPFWDCGPILSELPTSRFVRSVTITSSEQEAGEVEPWDHLPSTLEELALLFSDDRDYETNELDGLPEFLSRANDLHTLAIQWPFLAHLELPGQIGLPALRNLHVTGLPLECVRIMEALGFPDRIRRLTVEVTGPGDLGIEGIFPFVHRSSVSIPGDLYTTVGIGHTKHEMVVAASRDSDRCDGVVDLFAHGHRDYAYDYEGFKDISLCFVFSELETERDYEKIFPVFDGLDLSPVRILHMCNIHVTPDDIFRYFCSARAVEELDLVGEYAIRIFATFGMCLHVEGDKDDVGGLLFPTLRHLRIEGFDFNVLDPIDDASSVGRTFSRSLATRAQEGSTLESLVLTKCTLSGSDKAEWSAMLSLELHDCNVA